MAPLAARAQQPPGMRRIGVLMGGAEHDLDWQRLEAAFEQELKSLGWQRGRDIRIDYRWPGDEPDRVAAHAIELIEMGPDLIVTAAASGVQAVRRRTDAIPVVFVNAAEPVRNGLVANLARPGGNVTGFTLYEYGLSGKWLELLKEIVPRTTRAAVLRDPTRAPGIGQFAAIQSVAHALGIELSPVDVRDLAEIERIVSTFASAPNSGLIVTASPSAGTHRDAIIALAARHQLPTVYPLRYFVVSGGLVSYGPESIDPYRRAAGCIDRILKGEKPADLPVQSPTKFETVINLKTAKALGITIPQALLARADEVIE